MDLIGKRVLVRPCRRTNSYDTEWMGSDFNGAFAQFVKVKLSEVFVVHSTWSDADLASIPCSYGTAENQLERLHVSANDTVLIVGASGGVGSASVQLCRRRGVSHIVGISTLSKRDCLLELGCHEVIGRDEDLLSVLGENSFDVILDNVGGSSFPLMLKLLRRGGRYCTSGAIGGADVHFDMRDLYLKDLTIHGVSKSSS
jgi:NADPH:quinone reductase-like Zn-dependent oxidoreductase